VGKAVEDLAEVLSITKTGINSKCEAGYNFVSFEGGFDAMDEHVMNRCEAEHARAISLLIELLELPRGTRAAQVEADAQRVVKSCQESFGMIFGMIYGVRSTHKPV
jgi:hypothetical protein